MLVVWLFVSGTVAADVSTAFGAEYSDNASSAALRIHFDIQEGHVLRSHRRGRRCWVGFGNLLFGA